MVNKILIGFGLVNLILFLTGIVMPMLISTDKIPLLGIVFLVTSIAFTVLAISNYVIASFNQKGAKHARRKQSNNFRSMRQRP